MNMDTCPRCGQASEVGHIYRDGTVASQHDCLSASVHDIDLAFIVDRLDHYGDGYAATVRRVDGAIELTIKHD